MKCKFSALVPIVLCTIPVGAQIPAPSPSARSHVERYSTAEMRAEKAEAEATAKLTANPQDAPVFNARALARLRLNHYQEAYADLLQATRLNPTSGDYQANLGYALWKIGRASDAIDAERAALKLDDKSYTAHYQLGRFLLRVGDAQQLPEAAAHFRRALEIDPRQYDVRFELIAVYRMLHDTAQATAQLLLLQDARPSDGRVPYVRGLLAADRNDLNGAINDFREALQRDPVLAGAWQDLGLAYVKLSRWPDAVQALAESAKLQQNSVEAAYLLALAYYNAQQGVEAEKQVRRGLRLDPGTANAYTLLGIILASRGNANEEATEALTQALALNQANFDANFYLGRVQFAQKNYESAVQSFRAATKLDPKRAEARFFLGTALESTGESEAALIEYQGLVKLDPQSVYGQLGSGALLLRQGKKAEAINALERAVALDPRNFEARWSLGRALVLAERYSAAVDVLQAAIAIDAQRADAHYQLGQALRRLGRDEEATREFAIVDQINTQFRTNSSPQER